MGQLNYCLLEVLQNQMSWPKYYTLQKDKMYFIILSVQNKVTDTYYYINILMYLPSINSTESKDANIYRNSNTKTQVEFFFAKRDSKYIKKIH